LFYRRDVFITKIIDIIDYTLYDLAMTNTNELVSLAPSLVSEAMLIINENKGRFSLIEVESEAKLVSTIIDQLPQSDDDREGWINSLAIATIGYRKSQALSSLTTEEQNKKISKDLQLQLENDNNRWGDTWKRRPIEGQLDRTKARFEDYVDQYENGDQPFPWLKVMGGEIICLVRIDLQTIENYKNSLAKNGGFETK